MLCCMRRTKQVEKNDEVDQKIEQDSSNKPEDKAHKAATKIQASFRGHIIRKKLKGDKKENGPEINGEVGEKKNEIRAEVENHKSEAPVSEVSQSDGPQSIEGKKTNSSPTEERKQEKEGVLDAATKPAEQSQTTPVEEKQAAADKDTTTQGISENLHPSDADGSQAKEEESKQADVPATTPALDAAKTKEQPHTKTAAISQVEEKTDAAVEETKPTQSAQQEEVKDEESKGDQENA
uniref:Neuromodulin n=1 Tax=Geotrypetes seraphini TaxID=260995 RepID=A0A6P8QHE3_GEOSA|nr:neuromodulin [Geotrypetes seraphini]